MFSQDFRKDLDALLGVLRDQDAPAIALARFHDGEHALLRGRKYKAVSGWVGDGSKSWIVKPLMASLQCDLPGYHVGISDITTLPDAYNWYARHTRTARSRVTFAMLFAYANYGKSIAFFKQMRTRSILVGCTDECDVRVPSNASVDRFDVDDVVDQILDADKPALMAAGPAACLIAHRYWARTIDVADKRRHIIDVGAAIDLIAHGRSTRDYQESRGRLRSFVPKWSSRKGFMTDRKGNAVPTRARVAQRENLPNSNKAMNVRVRPSSSDPTSEHRKVPRDSDPSSKIGEEGVDAASGVPSFFDGASENARQAGPRRQSHTRRRR